MLSQDLRIVLRGLGLIVPTVGVMAAVSLPVAAAFGEWYALWPLGITALISFGLGAALYFPFRRAREAHLKHGLIIAALGWLLVTTIGALPLYLISIRLGGGYPYADMTNAFFESVSGFTTTGLSVALRPDLLPYTLQWWRSFTQWVGGLGVIVLMLTLVVGAGTSAMSMYLGEARDEKIHPSVISTVHTMWWIYSLFTFIGACALWTAGMPPWEAINHAMTGIATGGFSTSPQSIGGFPGLGIELAITLLMLFGAINYAVHYSVMQRGLKAFWENYEVRWLILICLIWVVFLFLENLLKMPALSSAHLSYFQVFSAATTTGFQTTDIRPWSDTAKLILSGAMFIGACAGSTGGGIKVIRMLILARGVGWRLQRLISSPNVIIPFRLGREALTDKEATRQVEGAAVITFLWMASIAIGVVVLLHIMPGGFTLADAILEVVSAQSTVGLSVGITHPEMATAGKLVLCFNMLFGRLEIIPFLMLFRSLLRGFARP